MNENEATIGTHVRIVDPTLVVAFIGTPELWTAGVYVITDATRPTYSYPDGIVAVRPLNGPRLAFRVAVENLELVGAPRIPLKTLPSND